MRHQQSMLDHARARRDAGQYISAPRPKAAPDGRFDQAATYPSLALLEQSSIFEACVRNGELHRARTMFNRLYDVAVANGSVETLRLFLPPKLHSAYLRACFKQAIQQPEEAERAIEAMQQWWNNLNMPEMHIGPPAIDGFGVVLRGLLVLSRNEDGYQIDPAFKRKFLEQLGARESSLASIIDTYSFADETVDEIPTAELIQLLPDFLGNSAQLEGVNLPTDEVEQPATPRTDSVPIGAVQPVQRAKTRGGEVVWESPFGLENLQRHTTSSVDNDEVAISDYERQRLLEIKAGEASMRRSEYDATTVGADTKLGTNQLQKLMSQWRAQMTADIEEMLQQYGDPTARRTTRHSHKVNPKDALLQLMQTLPPETLAHTTVVSLMRMASSRAELAGDALLIPTAASTIGRAINNEYLASQLQEYYPHLLEDARTKNRMGELKTPLRTDADLVEYCYHKMQQRAANKASQTQIPKLERWPPSLIVAIGGALVDSFTRVATIERVSDTYRCVDGLKMTDARSEVQPVFSVQSQFISSRRLTVLKVNPAVAERLSRDSLHSLLDARHLPMIVPPRLWTDWDQGGFLSVDTSVLRIRDTPEQKHYLQAASEAGDLDRIYAALDFLGATAWRINRKVFDVLLEAWNSGLSIGKLVSRVDDGRFDDPPKPSEAEHDVQVLGRWRKELIEMGRLRRGLHSERCDMNYKLEIARAYVGRTFYFPHNLDFRGRAYPMSPFFSHIGNDVCRGLLQFVEGKPLGQRGLFWLKVQVANTMGNDKISLTERAAWVDEHREDVFDSADDPLNGRGWWKKGDDPWQTLAAQMDLTAALRHPDGPENYVSHTPVHQDGTCNGLQHYASIGGDEGGAQHVNLVNRDRPGDIYSAVALKVAEFVKKEADEGNELAKLVDGQVGRKTVKQVVMTTVYGVTFMGAKRMIKKQLKDTGLYKPDQVEQLSIYLAVRVMASIGDVFAGANAIKQWLKVCARLICTAVPLEEGIPKSTMAFYKMPRMACLVWTTPLGLPVVQPYRKHKLMPVVTQLARVNIQDPRSNAATNQARQISALPPNYIHSLDSSHMMMTATECKKRGITFASVHDSFWTHPADVDELAKVLRDAFVELHSQPLLEDLRNEWLERYKNFVVAKSSVSQAEEEKTKNEEVTLDEDEDEGSNEEDEAGIADLLDDVVEAEEAEEEEQPPLPKPKPKKRNGVEQQVEVISVADALPPIPPRGSFDVSSVRDSQYFFS